jgi:hypothetical protein
MEVKSSRVTWAKPQINQRLWALFGKPLSAMAGLRSYLAALKQLDCRHQRRPEGWANSRAENGQLPFRRCEAAIQRFRSMQSRQKFVSVRASECNHLHLERHLISRQTYKARCTATQAVWDITAAWGVRVWAYRAKRRRVRTRLTAPGEKPLTKGIETSLESLAL